MRSKGAVFWYSLGLTLLLLLPMVGVTYFFVHQRQQQQELRQAAAERGGVRIEQGAQDTWHALLVVQQEEPGFVLVRVDGPTQTVDFCALPGELQVKAPEGTTTLAECTLSAGPGRAAQLLMDTIATGETAVPELYYLAATPDCWADCAGEDAVVRLDTAALLSKEERESIGYGEDSVAEISAAQAPELIAQLQSCKKTPGQRADMRAAVWEAFARQAPGLLAGMPQAWRDHSARTLTDLMATDLAGWEATLTYVTDQPGLKVGYSRAETQVRGRQAVLTEEGSRTVRDLLH